MRILYGVSGENLGHSSRAKAIIPFLLKKNNEILVLTYGDAYDDLIKYYGGKNSEFLKIEKIDGFHLHYTNKKLDIIKTFFHGTKTIESIFKKRKKILEKINQFNADVSITDFEPIVAYYSNYKRIPLISFDNQHAIKFSKFYVPLKYKKNYFLSLATIDLIVPKASYYIVLSFNKFKSKKNIYVCSPLIREKVLKSKIKNGNKIIVYINRKDDSLIENLKKIKENFIVYGYEIELKQNNIYYKKKGEQFIKDLSESKAVISSAGFSLLSECVFLRKPVFLIPQIGQFEQTFNALFVKESGFGEYSEKPCFKEITNFLQNLEIYRKNLSLKKIQTEESLKVLNEILEKIKNDKKTNF